METKKKRGRKPRIENLETSNDQLIGVRSGKVEGNYSTSTYSTNGVLINFQIDWDKLKEHMKKVS